VEDNKTSSLVGVPIPIHLLVVAEVEIVHRVLQVKTVTAIPIVIPLLVSVEVYMVDQHN
jgi:hypothetical protein